LDGKFYNFSSFVSDDRRRARTARGAGRRELAAVWIILATLGDDFPALRLSYLAGTLEIMTTSRLHEELKKMIGMLMEAYLQESRTRFHAIGSATFWYMNGDPNQLESLQNRRNQESHRKATPEYIRLLLEIIDQEPLDLGHEFGR